MVITFMKKRNVKKQFYNYFAVFEPAVEGGFNVSFPNFPGCVTFGRNFEEAKAKAQEVLGLWLAELFARHKNIPTKRVRPIVDEVEVVVPTK